MARVFGIRTAEENTLAIQVNGSTGPCPPYRVFRSTKRTLLWALCMASDLANVQ